MVGLVLVFFITGAVANNIDAFRSMHHPTESLALRWSPGAAEGKQNEPTQTLTPAMKAALDYVVQRYRVSAEALLPVFEAAQSIGPKRHLDPLLLIAVISVESRFNPFSQSPMGAQGLMQIIPAIIRTSYPTLLAKSHFWIP